MKKLLLPALFLGLFTAANAQMGGLGVSPLGATADDSITFYVDPSVMCGTTNPALGANPVSLRMHSGHDGWQDVKEAGALVNPGGAPGLPYSIVGFTPMGNGLWKKTIKPSAYYGATGIQGINMVLNGGPDDGNRWEVEGKYLDPGDGSCNDFYIPFPIVDTDFGFTGTRPRINNTFRMLGAVPNPASGSTTLRFELKKSGAVRARILNLLGKTIATLNDGFLYQGQKSLSWDASGVPAGIYFFTVEAGGATASSKVQVVR